MEEVGMNAENKGKDGKVTGGKTELIIAGKRLKKKGELNKRKRQK